MELDHLFLFTDTPREAAEALCSFGLVEGSPNTHPGQGTACRRFFFHNAYLELVWVQDEEELRNSPLARARLWERSRSRDTGYSPFGLCFRGHPQIPPNVSLLFADSWRYRAPFLLPGQFANIARNEAYPAEPMLFEMPFFGWAPTDYPEARRQPLVHPRGFKNVSSVFLTRPPSAAGCSPSMEQVLQQGCITLAEGTEHSVAVQFDEGKQGSSRNFHPLLPLVFYW